MLHGTSEPLYLAHDVALVDLDGVCYRGPDVIPYAAESLAAARDGGLAVRFVTNNASREPETIADHLTELGIGTVPDEVVTSAQAGAALLSERFPEGSSVLVVGGKGLHTAVTERGMRIVASAADAPVAVIQGWAPDVSWNELAEACYAIQRGATHIATNLDISIPKPGGIAPGNGPLVNVVTMVTGVEPLSTGKPHPEIFLTAAREAGARSAVVVGDRLDTDIAGAVAADMASLHVLTGVHDARTVLLAAPAERPSYLAIDLQDLLVPHPEPTRSLGGRASFDSPDSPTWGVGDARAYVREGALHLADGAARAERLDAPSVVVSLDGYRALVSATWAVADAGEPLDPQVVPELVVERR